MTLKLAYFVFGYLLGNTVGMIVGWTAKKSPSAKPE